MYYSMLREYFPNLVVCAGFINVSVPIEQEDGYATFRHDLMTKVPRTAPVHLWGYFQSWRYFNTYNNEIAFLFEYNTTVINRAQEVLHLIKQRHADISSSGVHPVFIGVHVRRGDLASPLNIATGYRIANVTYITHAMNYFRQKYNEAQFVVSSDDPAWCRQNIQGPDVHIHSSHQALDDLALLASCNHTVMTSGTFGWWAAYLAGGEAVYFRDLFEPGSKLDRDMRGEDYHLPHWKPMI